MKERKKPQALKEGHVSGNVDFLATAGVFSLEPFYFPMKSMNRRYLNRLIKFYRQSMFLYLAKYQFFSRNKNFVRLLKDCCMVIVTV